MKILISGGHLTPALAFIDYVQANAKNDVKLIFVGRLHSKNNKEQLANEAKLVEARSVKFIPFQTGKLSWHKPLTIPKDFFLFLIALLKSFWLIGSHKPDVFLSFGSYLAVPLAVSAWLWGIPVVTHEQTRGLGVANKFIAKLASTVVISYPESLAYLPTEKTIVTGNLIRKSILAKDGKKPDWIPNKLGKPLLYVTGGSQGSEVINLTVSQIILDLTKDWVVIHQCGQNTKYRNYFSELHRIKNRLPKTQQARYFVREWINESELAWIYSKATGVVARSGANTTQEISMRRLPAVFIPLPFARHNEQYENAKALSERNAAILLTQKKLSPKSLLFAIEKMNKQKKHLIRNLHELKFNNNPEESLFKIIVSHAS